MNKEFYKSKSVQGIVLMVAGLLWGLWSGESQISQSVVLAGLGYAGYGFRDAMK